jgi:large subunit ribosomal protein L13
MKTYMAKAGDVKNGWCHLNADDVVLGRLATKVARILMGKHKPSYTPHMDDGDFVVITNCEKIKLTGKKMETKIYRHYTGYLSGLRERSIKKVIEQDPTEVIYLAVKRMMPKSILGRQMLKKLKLYVGPDHPHKAQDPKEIDLSLV